MSGFTHGSSGFKQLARTTFLENVFASFPDRRTHLRALTFPALAGIEDPESVENQLEDFYRYCSITGVESDKATYEAMRDKAREMNMVLIRAKDSDLFRDFLVPKAGPFHAIFTDYMGGVSLNMLAGWNMMLREGWLAPGGVWGVTLNDGPRCHVHNQEWLGKEDLGTTLPKAMLRLMEAHGFKPSKKPMVLRYSCRDESSRAVPMVICVVFEKKPSLSAYEK